MTLNLENSIHFYLTRAVKQLVCSVSVRYVVCVEWMLKKIQEDNGKAK